MTEQLVQKVDSRVSSQEKARADLEQVRGTDEYGYDHLNYTGYNNPVTIFCKVCQKDFQQVYKFHKVRGCGCPTCAEMERNRRISEIGRRPRSQEECKMKKQKTKKQKVRKGRGLTVEDFLERARRLHGDTYDYNKIEFTNMQTKVQIFCNTCQDYFWQKPREHCNTKPAGCPTCGRKRSSAAHTYSPQLLRDQCINTHGGAYDYSNTDFSVGTKKKVWIHCNKCNRDFHQLLGAHMRGRRCTHCYANPNQGKDAFVEKAKNVHGDLYDYSKFVYVNHKTKGEIVCNTCGHSFWMAPYAHTSNQNGCKCFSHSRMEREIASFLISHQIPFETEKTFNDLRGKAPLRFDFYIPSKKLLIEAQGEQHYFAVDYFGGEKIFQKQQQNDQIKRDFCRVEGFKLLEIPYTKKKHLQEVLQHIS